MIPAMSYGVRIECLPKSSKSNKIRVYITMPNIRSRVVEFNKPRSIADELQMLCDIKQNYMNEKVKTLHVNGSMYLKNIDIELCIEYNQDIDNIDQLDNVKLIVG